jgi:hypothetical protein
MNGKPVSGRPDVASEQTPVEQAPALAEGGYIDFEANYPDGCVPCSGGPSKRVGTARRKQPRKGQPDCR